MLITFKSISQVTFQIEVDPSITIGQLKAKIASEKGETEFPADAQKLIYNGKILDDAQTVEEVKIDAAKFVVVMVARKKAPPAAASSTKSEPQAAAAPPATSASASAAAPADAATTTTVQTSATATATVAVSATAAAAAGAVPSSGGGEAAAAAAASATEQPQSGAQPAAAEEPEPLSAQHEETVEAIMAMGYERERVIRALRAAFFNGDRAVEYLCTSIPDEEEMAGVVEGEEEGETGADVSADVAGGLEFLRQLPQFEQLRELVQSNPAILPQIIQQIAQSNPALMEAIQNNQEQFVSLLNAPNPEGGTTTTTTTAGGGGAGRGAATIHGVGGARAGQPRTVSIQITESERDAINRLKSMGFPEQLVIEAYFACDKNEDLAVNYILAHMDEVAAEFDALEQHGQGGSS